ncbi:MAG: hypothetical protein ACP5EP_12385 [Acidobacteriaceae bacterium]
MSLAVATWASNPGAARPCSIGAGGKGATSIWAQAWQTYCGRRLMDALRGGPDAIADRMFQRAIKDYPGEPEPLKEVTKHFISPLEKKLKDILNHTTYQYVAKSVDGHAIGSHDGVHWIDIVTGKPFDAH